MTDQPRSNQPLESSLVYHHEPGFRLRRVRNWFFLGLTYASYYLCRYNLSIIAPELMRDLGFSKLQYGTIDAARNGAYAIGQFVNGLFTDKLGGKQAMTIGAVGTVIFNLAFGIVSWSKIGWLFAALFLVRLADGYVQAFGAPGMVKINTAWFRRQERGTFAGIFGFMINMGAMSAGKLGSLIATGFSVPLIFFTITVPTLSWRYMFFIPPAIVVIIVILMNILVKNHPEEAGYKIAHDDEEAGDDPHERIHLAEVFRRITSNSVVWIVASAYFCTGFVRTAIVAWVWVYFDEVWAISKTTRLYSLMAVWLLPYLASAGSLASGVISDKFFSGRRAPVAALLYLAQAVFLVVALLMVEGVLANSAKLAAVVILCVHIGCNATHSLLGTAAAMDLGGRKMAGFAAGVIDSFQYFGAMLAGAGLGWVLTKAEQTEGVSAFAEDASGFDPVVWFSAMLPWALLGTGLMTYLWLRHRGSDRAGT